MGHNFGLYHSHAWDCGAPPIGTGCTSIEYGDTLDVMGGSSYHFNAFQKERLGWLNYGASPPITPVTASGTYSIDGYEAVGEQPEGAEDSDRNDRQQLLCRVAPARRVRCGAVQQSPT